MMRSEEGRWVEESRKVGAINNYRTSHRFTENTQKDEFSWGYLLCYLKVLKLG